MQVASLFPPCFREDCDERGREHRHILPSQQEVLDSDAKYLALIGGFGSGKTLPCNILGHLLSTSIPGNMGIVMRRSLPKLHDATERFYLEVLDRSGEEVQYREVRDGWPHRIIYPNGSEVLFRETKDLGRFLGPEFGWFFLDEAQEEPEKTFKDLTGRLRLPRAARWLKGMIASNPPHHLHWIAKFFQTPGVWETVESISGRRVTTSWQMIRSSTRDNPFLDPEYVAGLLRTHSPSEVKSIIEGFYGFGYEGKPVFPGFEFTKHVGDFPARLMTLIRSWDFGWHRPACYTEDHDILTREGWKPIGTVHEGELVATLSARREVEYQPVRATIQYEYNGPTYHWKCRNSGLDLEVTPDHLVVRERRGKLSFQRADSLAPHGPTLTPIGRVRDGKPIGEARAVLLGLYLSEGSTRYDGKHYMTWIWQKSQDPWMDDWLKRTGYPWKYYSDKRGGRGWAVAGKEMHKWLAPFGHAREKFVPEEIKTAPEHEIRLFLEAYTRGDGDQSGRITTYSPRMAGDLQELFALVGVPARVKPVRDGYTVTPHRKYRPRLDPKHLVVEHKRVNVACVMVENHVILVRRKGSVPVWCGNCTWHQMFRCKKGQVHWLTLHEYLGQDVTSEAFAQSRDPDSGRESGVLPETLLMFPTVPRQLIYDVGDSAGAAVNERGPGPIVRLARPRSQGGFELEFHYRKLVDIDPGLDLIRRCLRTKCSCGYYLLMVHRRCVYTIEALAGGYHYPPEKPGKEVRKPVKDGFYDNIADTVRYAGENVYRTKLLDDQFLDEMAGIEAARPDWAWMEG